MKIDRLKKLLNLPTTPDEIYHEYSKFKSELKFFPKDKWPDEWKQTYFKNYSRLEKIPLDTPSDIPDYIKERKSTRNFSKKKISLSKLSCLLFCSAGQKDSQSQKRSYPSAGARYPLEVYVLSLNSDLTKGIYHYNVSGHYLEKLTDIKSLKIKDYFNYSWASNASLVILITAVFNRSKVKYLQRGYRYALIEAGHLGQNFYINSTHLNLGCCSMGGFIDDKLNELICVDGLRETTIYTLAVGELP